MHYAYLILLWLVIAIVVGVLWGKFVLVGRGNSMTEDRFFEKYQFALGLKKPPTKEEAEEIIRNAAKHGNVIFETSGATIDCVCKNCGWEWPMTFFKREYDVEEDAGPCGECGEWAMKAKE